MKHFYEGLPVCLCCAVLLFSCRNESTQEIGMYTGYTFPGTAEVVRTAEADLYGADVAYYGTVTNYYLKGCDGIPFIDGAGFALFWKKWNLIDDSNIETAQTDSTYTITRTDMTPNVSLTLDASAQTISSKEFILFDARRKGCLDYTRRCALLARAIEGFCEVKDASVTAASPVTFDINTDYGLKMYPYTDSEGNKKILIPAELAGLIIFGSMNQTMVYNGSDYYINPDSSGLIIDSYLSDHGRGGTRTRAEAEFNYRLLCMLFDRYYGLRYQRTADMNDGFNTFVYNNNLEQALLSSDPAVYDDALVKVLMTYVDDCHTGYMYPSYYESVSSISYYQQLRNKYRGPRDTSLLAVCDKLKSARKAAFNITDSAYAGGLRYINDPDTGVPAIAVITFDNFLLSGDYTDYRSKKTAMLRKTPEALAKTDSFELFYNALSRIQAYNADSSHTRKITNVIIDESCNSGGSIDTGMYLANIFVKNAELHYREQLEETQNTFSYDVDTDLDGNVSDVTNGWDLSALHVYVLTSGYSFSCANFFASIMKDQQDGTLNVKSVKLVGQKSGGGSCVVIKTGTGDGSMFQTSSTRELTYKAGTSVDGGVDVDTELDYSVFYDNDAMYNALYDKYQSNFQ